jgi:hypothetical protein
MSRIVEYIGNDNVISSDRDSYRLSRPRPGDVVVWDIGEYPLDKDGYGRIESINFLDTGKIHFCCNDGSVFMRKDYVSISGGPFSKILELGG